MKPPEEPETTGPRPSARRIRRIIANLDCETELARAAAAARRARGGDAPPSGDPRFALPGAVESAISALATLLRVFAREGDRLWTPREVAPGRLAPVSGLPLPLLETGPLEDLTPAAEVLSWGETARTDLVRAAGRDPGAGAPRREPAAAPALAPAPGDLAGALWAIPAAGAAAAARANHRSFSLEVARSLGRALPGARMVSSLAELEAHLKHERAQLEGGSGGAAAAEESWVLKAPFSAAGRSRLRGKGRSLDPSARRRAERLLFLHGALLFEPWLERLADFGSSALLFEGECRVLGFHRLRLDGGGNFRGIELLAPGDGSLSAEEEALFTSTVEAAGASLRAAGYRGPFGLDGWRYRDRQGKAAFHPLGEINARMTFGLVARALAGRAAGGRPEWKLRVGRGEELEAARAAGIETVPLLLPDAADPTSAWLE